MSQEVWLIEWPARVRPPVWFCPQSKETNNARRPGWTSNALEAVMFHREQDALAVIDYIGSPCAGEPLIATAHLFDESEPVHLKLEQTP